MSKVFSTRAILTAHSGIVCTDNFGEVHELLAYLVDDENLMTHQLPEASRQVEDGLQEQFPWLMGIDLLREDPDVLKEQVEDIETVRGTLLDVEQVDCGWEKGRAISSLLAKLSKPAENSSE